MTFIPSFQFFSFLFSVLYLGTKEGRKMWFILDYYRESTSHSVVPAFSSHLSSYVSLLRSFHSSPLALLLKTHLLHKSKECSGGCRIISMSTQQFPAGASELIKSSNLRCAGQYMTLCAAKQTNNVHKCVKTCVQTYFLFLLNFICIKNVHIVLTQFNFALPTADTQIFTYCDYSLS